MSNNWKFIYLSFSILFSSFLLSCAGGGSQGTGTESYAKAQTMTIEGSIHDDQNQPIEGLEVTLLANGQSGITDSAGNFLLASDPLIGNLELSIQFDSVDEDSNSSAVRTTVIENVPPDTTGVGLDLILDEKQGVIGKVNIQIRAEISGVCASYFDNDRTITQIDVLPAGIICSLQVAMFSDGHPLTQAPFVLQTRACPEGSAWFNVARGWTDNSPFSGRGHLDFPYFEDMQHCVYRLVSPTDMTGFPQIVYEIITLSKQRFDEGNAPKD